jgi:DNA-binding NarL/FixJ family response regulator
LELPIMDGVETVMSIYKEAPDARLVVFTTRQGEVIRAVANGKSNKEIAAALVISEATVKVHVTHILEKLKVAAQTEAINVAVRRGLVRLDLIGAA